MTDWKHILNTAVERTLVDGINFVGGQIDNPACSGSIANLIVRSLTSETVRLTGRKITKDQILRMLGNCTKSGLTGAAIDGALAAHKANQMYRVDKIDRDTFIEHVTKESACGFVSSASGSAATIITSLVVGSGTASVLVGIGTAIGTRYAYRICVDDVFYQALADEAEPLSDQVSWDDLFSASDDEDSDDDDEIDIEELLGGS